jgi:hypothetical protein
LHRPRHPARGCHARDAEIGCQPRDAVGCSPSCESSSPLGRASSAHRIAPRGPTITCMVPTCSLCDACRATGWLPATRARSEASEALPPPVPSEQSSGKGPTC